MHVIFRRARGHASGTKRSHGGARGLFGGIVVFDIAKQKRKAT
jgi:hypothetical protein